MTVTREHPFRVCVVAGILTILSSVVASGQAADVPRGTLKLGPLSAQPRVSFFAGIDDNVFYEATDPKRDETFSVVPQVEIQLRVGRATVSGTSTYEYNHFARYEAERSSNTAQVYQLEVPLNRLTFRSSYSLASTRARPGLEIDLRIRQLSTTYSVGVDARIRARTTFRFNASSTDLNFQSGVVNTVSVPEAMNRTGESAVLSVRHALTPLTAFVFSGEVLRDRFEFDASRDATGIRVMPGLEFGRLALISGGLSVGLRQFRPNTPSVPKYSGLAARINLSSVIRRSTRLAGQLDRDLSYSLDKERPYYVLTSATVSVTQRLGTRWDLVGSAGGQELAYRALNGAAQVPAGTDLPPVDPGLTRGRTYGVSLGYLAGRGLRISLDGRRSERRSGMADRDFTARVFGGFVTYAY